MTVDEAVAEGARLFANAEEALAALAAGMPSVITAVRDGGQIGAIECMRQIATAGATINGALGAVADLHAAQTKRCVELGIDPPQPRSGGPR